MSSLRIADKGARIEVPSDQIKYIKGDGNYSIVYADDRQYLMSKTLRVVFDELADPLFVRVHKQYIINLGYVIALSSHLRQSIILLESGEEVPIARRSIGIKGQIESYLAQRRMG